MDGDEDSCEVEHCRQDRHDGNLSVWYACELGHEEGGGSHDRWHDLSARAGRGLNGGSELAPVTHLLHHRNRYGAGTDCVRDRGSGGHALQGAGDNGDLCRSSCEASDGRVGESDEEICDSGALQEGSEDDEDDDVLHADADRGGEDSVCCVEKRPDQLCQPDPACQSVDDKRSCHAEDRQTHTAAAEFDQGQDSDCSDCHENRIRHDPGGESDDSHCVGCIVEICPGSHDHDHNVVPWHVVRLLDSLFHGEGQETQKYDHAHENRVADLLKRGQEDGVNDAVDGEGRHDVMDDSLSPSGPYAGV